MELKSDARKLYSQFAISEERPPTLEEMRYMLNEKTMIRPSTGFYDLFKKIVEDKQNEGTRKQYNQSWRVLNKKFPRLTYNQVDSEFFRKLVDYLENEKKYSRNNILKHIKRLREVMRRAYALGYTDNREYLTFRYSAESVKPVTLDERELSTIWHFPLKSVYLDNARDLFLVGCWTGLRFSDYSRLTVKNIHSKVLKIRTLKTSAEVVIPILDPLRVIIEKQKKISDGMRSFPEPISNQKLNQYIKDVCKEIPELQKSFTMERTTAEGTREEDPVPKWTLLGSHVGRRSFCTNAYEAGIPVRTIMKISGHKTETMFRKYINREDEKDAEDMMNGWKPSSHLKVVNE
jgi:integrase